MIGKLSILAILTLFLSACAMGPPTPHSPPHIPKSPESPSNPNPPASANGGASESSQPETQSAETTSGDPSDEASSETETQDGDGDGDGKDRAKRKRIILKTVYDDKRVGNDQRDEIEAELGLVQDEELLKYVRSVGIRLLRYAPPQPFDYEFQIVDQSVPNAFALPGGKIYVSRGLLALVQTEDELAGVLGHEITHAAERHSAARIDYSRRLNPFSIGYLRAAAIAAYGRGQEKDADRGGQIMAAKAGYNPTGIARFLRKLDASDRYEVGWSRLPNFLATHPTSPKRAALASDRAAGISWERQSGIAEGFPLAYYHMVDGLILGDNPAGGLFDGNRFIHPDLGFSIRFPQGWTTMNSQQAVSAISPSRDAQATLTVEGEGLDIDKVVDDFIKQEVDGTRVRVRDRRSVKIGNLPAIRIEGIASNGLLGLTAQMTFVAHKGFVYRLAVLSLSPAAAKYRGRGRAFAHSFRPLDEAGIHSLKVTRLRIARALQDETLQELSLRTHNELELVFTGLSNNLYATSVLEKGKPVKIGLAEPYLPKREEEEETEGKKSESAVKAEP